MSAMSADIPAVARLLAVLVGCVIVGLGLLGISATMLSSRISRQEEEANRG